MDLILFANFIPFLISRFATTFLAISIPRTPMATEHWLGEIFTKLFCYFTLIVIYTHWIHVRKNPSNAVIAAIPTKSNTFKNTRNKIFTS